MYLAMLPSGTVDVPFFKLQPPFLGTKAVTLFTAVDKDALKDALQDDW